VRNVCKEMEHSQYMRVTVSREVLKHYRHDSIIKREMEGGDVIFHSWLTWTQRHFLATTIFPRGI